MFSLSRNVLGLAAAGSLVLLAASVTSASADDMVQNLGPVGPQQPILATVGDKHVIAFFAPVNGRCNLQAVVWDADDPEATSASGIRISLGPNQAASIDATATQSFALKCGANADSLALLANQQFASR